MFINEKGGADMKNRFAVLVGALMIMAGSSHALTSSQLTTFNVTVSTLFQLSIDQGYIDFGKMKPGETKGNMPPEGVTVQAQTNNGKPWYLKVCNGSPFSYGDEMIPNNNFMWSGWTDGAGKWYGTGNNKMTTTPTIIYESAASEYNNLPNGTNCRMKFRLKVPDDQAPGNYATTVKFTMTE